ncbi:MAG: SPOCS domain-containing protein [Christensenellales bacterium]|jgi:LysM repeat protein
MPFDSSKKIITAYDGAASAREQVLVEGTALLPGITGGAKILHADARAEIISSEVQNDRLAVGGTVAFDILYTGGEDKKAAGTKAQYTFSHILEMKGAKPGMQVSVHPRVETITADAGGSKANLRAVLTLEADAHSIRSEEVLQELSGAEFYSLQKNVSICERVGYGQARMLLEAETELPFAAQAEEIVFSSGNVRALNVTTYDDRLTIEGELVIDAYYLIPLTDKPIAKSRHTFPFETQVAVDGLTAGRPADVEVIFKDSALNILEPAEDAPKSLRVEGVLTALAICEETVVVPVLEDAFSTAKQTAILEKKVMPLKTGTFSQSGNDTVKISLSLDEAMPKIGTMLAVFARPIDYEIIPQPKANAAGALEITIVYMPDGGTFPVSARQEVPFEANFDFAVPENARTKITVRDADATQTASDQVELRVQLVLSAKADIVEETELVVSAEPAANGLPEKSSISIYFAREGDTMWSVAKQYLMPVDTLRKFNPELDDRPDTGRLTAGQKAILYRKGIS